jgi:hypothetical protein
MVVAINPTEFIVVGQGAQVDFHKAGCDVELDSVRELMVTGSGLKDGRFLNGDERLEILSDKHITAVRLRILVNAESQQ